MRDSSTSRGDRKDRKEVSIDIGLAIEQLVKERLGLLEDAILLGNKLYKKPTPKAIESYLHKKLIPQISAKITLEVVDVNLGENVHFGIEVQNLGKTQVLLSRVEDIIPNGFELVAHSSSYDLVSTSLDLHGKRLNPNTTESLEITLRANNKGLYILSPKVFFKSDIGGEMSYKPEPVSINVLETILPGRISTGFSDLDNLLFGGIPQNYSVVLTSVSCDERDLLVKRFLEAGLEGNDVTLYITKDPIGVRNLAEKFQSNFYVFACNPKTDGAFEKLPNVFKLGGVENLTEMNIILESIFRRLVGPRNSSKRVCLDIISDVLLQHHAAQTRKWLSGLVQELRLKSFTTLAVMNPLMHASEETHAVLDLFEGEITIYEKETQRDLTKYLRIKKMYNQRYLESELPLRKTRLMPTPLVPSCCARTSNL